MSPPFYRWEYKIKKYYSDNILSLKLIVRIINESYSQKQKQSTQLKTGRRLNPVVHKEDIQVVKKTYEMLALSMIIHQVNAN